MTDRKDHITLDVDRDDRRLAHDDALSFHIDQRVSCTQVDTDIF